MKNTQNISKLTDSELSQQINKRMEQLKSDDPKEYRRCLHKRTETQILSVVLNS